MYSKEAMSLYEELLTKVSSDISFTKEKTAAPNFLSNLHEKMMNQPVLPWMLGAGGAAGLGGLYLGRQSRDATNLWDKLKYGLTGASMGLTAPILLNNLLGAQSPLAFTPNNEAFDFTSV